MILDDFGFFLGTQSHHSCTIANIHDMVQGEMNTKLQHIPVFVGEERVQLRNVRDENYNTFSSQSQITINIK